MALFTSANGKFEIVSLSFTPNRVTIGGSLSTRSETQKTTYSIGIKNCSGQKITKLAMSMGVGWINADGEEDGSSPQDVYGSISEEYRESISWANNANKVFTGTWNLEYDESYTSAPAFAAHALQPYYSTLYGSNRLLHILISANDSISDRFDDISGTNQTNLAVLDRFYSPSIITFAAERVLNDEDPNIKTSVKLSLADGLTNVQKARMKWTVYGNGTSIPYNTSVTLAELLTGITNSTTFITQQFDKDSNHRLTLTFGDEYEMVTSPTIIVPRGFANVHLSGNADGGVCFGGFCDSDNPGRFECYYPAYFYGGIAQGGADYPSVGTEQDTRVKWVDGKTIYRKVIQFSSVTNGSRNDIAIGASGTISEIIRVYGICSNASGYRWVMPHYDSNSVYSIMMEVYGIGSTPKVRILPGKSRGVTSAWVAVEYTLTT